MTAVYPTTLPQFVLEQGYAEKFQSQTVESGMDTGPMKSRRRFSRAIREFSITLELTPQQRETFETFWLTTLRGGALPFEWVHPLTRVATTFRFKNPAPAYSVIGGFYSRVSFTLLTV
jgi:hypothetical protein